MEIYENCRQYSAFPEADDVFATNFEKDRLLPLGILKVDIDGVYHEVLISAPIADEEGMIGIENKGESCGDEWLTYSQRNNGKWAIDCCPDDLLSFECHRVERNACYEIQKHVFSQYGYIPVYESQTEPCVIFSMSDDESTNYYNWYGCVSSDISHRLEDVPGREGEDEKRVTLVGANGYDYVLLGKVNIGMYLGRLSPLGYYFYNSAAKKVLVVYSYS